MWHTRTGSEFDVELKLSTELVPNTADLRPVWHLLASKLHRLSRYKSWREEVHRRGGGRKVRMKRVLPKIITCCFRVCTSELVELKAILFPLKNFVVLKNTCTVDANNMASPGILTSLSRTLSQVSTGGICGGQTGTGVVYIWLLWFLLPIIIPLNVPHSSIIRG
jgi:hypothetical protein